MRRFYYVSLIFCFVLFSLTSFASQYTVSGTVSGLGGILKLKNQSNVILPIIANGKFKFSTLLAPKTHYSVLVVSQPANQICTPTNNSGTIGGNNVTNVKVTCSNKTFAVKGTISGLTSAGLTLQNNSTNDLLVPKGATSFTFSTKIAYGSGYNVTVLKQPIGKTCTITKGYGFGVTADVTGILIKCSTSSYTIGGTISGLTRQGLVLQNNGADGLYFNAGITKFTFPKPVAYGGSYNVKIQQQPENLFCNLDKASGNKVSTNVTKVAVYCRKPQAYILNAAGNSVTKCDLTPTGEFTNCKDSTVGPIFNQPVGVFLIPSGKAYITNYLGNSVSKCQIGQDSSFLSCSDSGVGAIFNSPAGIVFNTSGNWAYVVNSGLNSVLKCSVANGSFVSCHDSGAGAIFFSPIGITLNPTGNRVYVTNSSSHKITKCDLTLAGNFANCSDSGVGAFFLKPYGVILNTAGTRAYITNNADTTVNECSIDAINGKFVNCTYPNSGFNGPLGITVNTAGTRVYVTNFFGNSVSKCEKDSNGIVLNCNDSGAGAIFAHPSGIVIYGN